MEKAAVSFSFLPPSFLPSSFLTTRKMEVVDFSIANGGAKRKMSLLEQIKSGQSQLNPLEEETIDEFKSTQSRRSGRLSVFSEKEDGDRGRRRQTLDHGISALRHAVHKLRHAETHKTVREMDLAHRLTLTIAQCLRKEIEGDSSLDSASKLNIEGNVDTRMVFLPTNEFKWRWDVVLVKTFLPPPLPFTRSCKMHDPRMTHTTLAHAPPFFCCHSYHIDRRACLWCSI
jgi:hypothetical protein